MFHVNYSVVQSQFETSSKKPSQEKRSFLKTILTFDPNRTSVKSSSERRSKRHAVRECFRACFSQFQRCCCINTNRSKSTLNSCDSNICDSFEYETFEPKLSSQVNTNDNEVLGKETRCEFFHFDSVNEIKMKKFTSTFFPIPEMPAETISLDVSAQIPTVDLERPVSEVSNHLEVESETGTDSVDEPDSFNEFRLETISEITEEPDSCISLDISAQIPTVDLERPVSEVSNHLEEESETGTDSVGEPDSFNEFRLETISEITEESDSCKGLIIYPVEFPALETPESVLNRTNEAKIEEVIFELASSSESPKHKVDENICQILLTCLDETYDDSVFESESEKNNEHAEISSNENNRHSNVFIFPPLENKVSSKLTYSTYELPVNKYKIVPIPKFRPNALDVWRKNQDKDEVFPKFTYFEMTKFESTPDSLNEKFSLVKLKSFEEKRYTFYALSTNYEDKQCLAEKSICKLKRSKSLVDVSIDPPMYCLSFDSAPCLVQAQEKIKRVNLFIQAVQSKPDRASHTFEPSKVFINNLELFEKKQLLGFTFRKPFLRSFSLDRLKKWKVLTTVEEDVFLLEEVDGYVSLYDDRELESYARNYLEPR